MQNKDNKKINLILFSSLFSVVKPLILRVGINL